MNIAAMIIAWLALVNLGMDIAKHGQARQEKHNGWITLFATIITMILYYYAGMFK